jgi:cytochrome c oxidase subunit 4
MSEAQVSTDAAHPDAHDHGLSHVLPWQVLVGVLGVLLFFTWATVAVRGIDLGSMNLIIAMIIATIKAVLVMAIFMHLRWDNPYHSLWFLGSFVFVALFISIALLDKSEYEPDINERAAEVEAAGG